MKLKWLLLLSAVFIVKGFADEEMSVEERIEFLEDKRAYHFKKKAFKGIVRGELLYWKADVDGVATATTSVSRDAAGGSGQVSTHIKTRTPHFSYDPGFRVGIGVQSPFDLFDFFVVWTRFYTQGNDRARGALISSLPSSGDKVIFDGIGLIKEMVSIPNRTSSECEIRENLIDLQLARGIEVSRHFFMRPYFGIRGVLSDIDWNIKMKRDFTTPGSVDQDSTELKIKNDFDAVGGLIGLNLDWKVPMGFGIRVQGSGALIWGHSEERTKQKYLFIPAGGAARVHQNFKAGNSFYSLKGLWEIYIAVFWETHFPSRKDLDRSVFTERNKRQATLRLLAGYEIQQWPFVGQKTNIQISRERDRFSLGFHGFTGGVGLVF